MHVIRFPFFIFGFSILWGFLLGFSGCIKNESAFDMSNALYSKFSGETAFAHVKELVNFGPRPAGSSNLEKSREYIVRELTKVGWATELQTVDKLTPEGTVKFTNVRARFNGRGWSEQVSGMICSHYDTKKFGFEFVGANDGGSSTGALLEMGRVLGLKPELAREIEMVFFDGEEAFGPNITTTDGLYGSRHYASLQVLVPVKKRPKWGILLDMVGDKDLNIRAAVQIPNSSIRDLKVADDSGHSVDMGRVNQSLELMSRQLLSVADDLKVRSKIGISSEFIIDDHIPLNTAAGIPTINLIDFDYQNYWHTPADTLDKISAESLEIAGKVTLLLIEKYLIQ